MSRKFNIKNYKSLEIKESIAEHVASACFVYSTDGKLLDYSETNKIRTMVYQLFFHYTDLEIPVLIKKDNETDEDFFDRVYGFESEFINGLIEDGSYGKLIDKLTYSGELDVIDSAINSKIEFKKKEIDDKNSLGNMLMNLLQTFLNKAPDTQEMNNILENFKNMDMNKYSYLMELKNIIK